MTIATKLEDNPHYSTVLRYAKGVMERNGHRELDLPHIALGAYAALDNDALTGSRVLQLHMRQYKTEIDRFLEVKQWKRDSTQHVAPADITDALNGALEVAAKGEDPLIAFINASLQAINDEVKLFNTAIHEAGHAVVSLMLRPEVRLVKVTIQADREKSASGYAQYDSSSVTFKEAPSREFAFEHICVCLAGRVAQIGEFGPDAADVGAVADMDAATEMAFKAVTLFGLDPELGPLSLDVAAKFLNHLPGGSLPGEVVMLLLNKLQGLAENNVIDAQEFALLARLLQQNGHIGQPSGYLFDLAQQRVQALIKQAYAHTEALVKANIAAIRQVANLLLEKKTLSEEELLSVLPTLNTIEQSTKGV